MSVYAEELLSRLTRLSQEVYVGRRLMDATFKDTLDECNRWIERQRWNTPEVGDYVCLKDDPNGSKARVKSHVHEELLGDKSGLWLEEPLGGSRGWNAEDVFIVEKGGAKR